jgi:hypothetical protein
VAGEVELRDAAAVELKRTGFFSLGSIFSQDSVRGWLAFAFVAIFAGTIAGAFVCVCNATCWPQMKELLQLLLPAETALLGSAVGFYFGSIRRDDSPPK